MFLRFFFTVVIYFSLHAMLPLLANKDEYKGYGGDKNSPKSFLAN